MAPLLLLLLLLHPSLAFRRLVAEFRHEGSLNLSSLTLDTVTGRLYVAGTNVLYQLDDFLRLKHVVETGPVADSHQCGPSGCADAADADRGGGVELELTDNHNKILVLAKDQLIVCGTVKQGICAKYAVADIAAAPPEVVGEAVAANRKEATTFAFVGPTQYSRWARSNVLYVGTTFTNHGDYRHDVPAISSRNLHDLKPAEDSFSKQSMVRIDVKYRDHFLVNYIYGFNSSRHVYFATVQKKSYLPGEAEAGYISRISRSCITDSNFDTYSEVSLECRVDGENFNLLQAAVLLPAKDIGMQSRRGGEDDPVLLGVFAPADVPTARPRRSSALCAYRLSYIDRLFDENIHMCFNGSLQYRGLPYISGPVDEGNCPAVGSSGNILDFCETALKISGPVPLIQEAGLRLPAGSLATAVTGASLGTGGVVAVVGTADGDIIKAVLWSGTSGSDAILVDTFKAAENEPILPGTTLAAENSADLIVLTPRRVRRVKIADCGRHRFCGDCLSRRDPFCGWCSLANECRLQADCRGTEEGAWLSAGSAHQQCIQLEDISPGWIPAGEPANISLQISALPELPSGDHYQCLYDVGGGGGGRAVALRAEKAPGGLVCPAPLPESRPAIPAGADHVTMNLAVTLRHNGVGGAAAMKEFVSTSIMVYSCNSHSTCLDCVASRWPCAWCVYTNRCSHVSNSQSCKEVILSADTSVFHVLGANPSQLTSRGVEYCPRVAVVPRELYVPNNVAQELSLTVTNLPPDLLMAAAGGGGSSSAAPQFHCQVEIEGAKFVIKARLEAGGSRIICDRTTYAYESAVSEYNATISVLWDTSNVLDRTNITLYKCSLVGSYHGHSDCSLCMTRTTDLGCVWCGTGCEFTRHCPVGQSDVCPQPRIEVVRPLSGPIDGGTTIQIEGSNLAMGLAQLRGRVMLGANPCHVTGATVSVRIECTTPRVGRETELPVRLRSDNGIIESTVRFRYRDVAVTGVTPRFGPMSGGTTIAVEGSNLNIGSSLLIYLDSIPCVVNPAQVTGTRVTCTTGPAAHPMDVRSLIVIIDDARRSLANPYTYTPDPTIVDVRPKWSFVSGGRILTVHGKHLNTVEQPYIAALDDRGQGVGRSACVVISSTQMDCPSPAVVAAAAQLRSSESKTVSSGGANNNDIQSFRIGFEMDQVRALLNLAQTGVNAELLYVEDPVYYKFLHSEKSYKGDAPLVIEGANLNLAADESDLDVRIGAERCNVTSLTATQMLCIPPQTPPSGAADVVVYVGKNLKFEIGHLRYDLDGAGGVFSIPPEVIGGIGAAAALTLFIAIAFMIVYKHKSSQAEREYKRIQIQMDTLENNVRSECKQAFAELQTDMSDLTMDLEVSGIPLLDHRTFVTKVFFPGVGDHPLFLDPRLMHGGMRPPRSDLDAAMGQFDQLISNKWFLIAFVETMERQKSFTIRDRVNVASLLMVVLMTRMEYCSEILRCLLLKLVEKSLSSKHPHLMLRRTESIVEKMLTNWLALCLYDYMKDYAGSSLFVLFKAIKFQIEKGPVDAITHEARYSLSEDRLLREAVVTKTVLCCVVQDELEEEVVVRVLDCDSISQVKGKILDAVYKNTPFSLRPTVDEVDLEWRCGQYSQLGTPGGQLVLQDIDITSKTETNGMRRLNTLAHYGVKEKVMVSLVPKQIDSPSHHIYQAVSVGGKEGLYGPTTSAAAASPPLTDGVYHYASANQYQGVYAPAAAMYSASPVPMYSPGPASMYSPTPYSGALYPTSSARPEGCFYHLSKPDSLQNIAAAAARSHKSIPEIFLTRLLSTKGTIQKFVDDFFGTILKVAPNFPPPVKWLFDLLDEAAAQHGVNSAEIVHAWKSNCLPLRFWVNFIKNPDFIFDVNKTVTSDSSLSVIAQTFMDSCSLNENILGKDSPASKLLFAKDIPLYRQLLLEFYADIQQLPQVTDQELNFHLQQLSSAHAAEFDNMAALKELYIYVSKYYGELMTTLDECPTSRKLGLGHKLKSLAMAVYPQQQGPGHC